MKIVNTIGGLGNQMFQYAFAIALQKSHPKEIVKIDTQHYRFPFIKKFKGNNFYHNGFEIYNVFPNADIREASPWELIRLSYYIPNYILSRVARRVLPERKTEYILPVDNYFYYQEDAIEKKGDCYYEGVWSSIKYFTGVKKELQKQFSFGTPNEYNAKILNNILDTDSVAMHIRRGDYVNAPNFKDICTFDYYKKAIETILKLESSPVFYIFSNDIEWCKQNIEPLLNGNKSVYVSGNRGKDSSWDMFLMGHCKSQILANSSFSWWSAFLNPRAEHIIVPSRWINRSDDVEMYDESWIKIKV